jgi:hypothetical protein
MRPDTVALAHKLARKRPKGGKRSLAQIAGELASAGHLTGVGTEYAPAAAQCEHALSQSPVPGGPHERGRQPSPTRACREPFGSLSVSLGCADERKPRWRARYSGS